MWQYNFDYLCHSSHKYIDKYQKNGKTVYVYDKDGSIANRYNHPISSVIPKKNLSASTRDSIRKKSNPKKIEAQKEYDKKLINLGWLDPNSKRNAVLQEWERKSKTFEKDITKNMETALSIKNNVTKYMEQLNNLPDNAKKQDIDGAAQKLYSELSRLIQERSKIVKKIPSYVKENTPEDYQKIVADIDNSLITDIWDNIGKSFTRRGYRW